MGLTRINTIGGNILLGIDGQDINLTSTEKARVSTDKNLRDELEAKFGKALPIPVFYHKNRDGSIVVATGEVPDVWPEDES